MNGPLVELREDLPGKLVLRGYASVSERWYLVGRMFEEKVKRGTWRKALSEGPDTVLVQDHGGLAYARTKTPSGTPSLLLSETDRGLFCEAFLDASAPRVQDLRSTSENAGLQMSVGFVCSKDRWNEDRTRRELLEANVDRGDVTVTNYGANEATAATISERGEQGEAERRAYVESLAGSREQRMCPDFELRGRSRILVPSYIETAKYRKARRASGRMMQPPPRYTDAEIQALGRKGFAHKKKDGTYNFPIMDRHDLVNALHAYPRAAEQASVKNWIIYRAGILKLHGALPERWDVDAYKQGL
jgi:HK97 family phage prohead protease